MKFPVHIPFVEHLGFELLHFEADEAELAIEVRPQLANSLQMLHGGVTMTLLDVAMAHAARSPATPGAPSRAAVVTIEMKTTFIRPGLGRLRARARVLTRTLSLVFCEGSVFDAEGALVAHATGTFKPMKTQQVQGSD